MEESQLPSDKPASEQTVAADDNVLKKFVEIPVQSDHSKASREQSSLYTEEKVLRPQTSGHKYPSASLLNSTESHGPLLLLPSY
uniref:Uncharacterized protein n=1 Tax=Arundo donax TaxID=35708 RepID=A0A0A9DCV2_ARUDO